MAGGVWRIRGWGVDSRFLLKFEMAIELRLFGICVCGVNGDIYRIWMLRELSRGCSYS